MNVTRTVDNGQLTVYEQLLEVRKYPHGRQVFSDILKVFLCKQFGKVAYWSTRGGFPAHVWNNQLNRWYCRQNVHRKQCCYLLSPLEKSGNLMWSGCGPESGHPVRSLECFQMEGHPAYKILLQICPAVLFWGIWSVKSNAESKQNEHRWKKWCTY